MRLFQVQISLGWECATIALPKVHLDFNLVAKNVAHFYVGLPAYNGEHPSTPACSTAVYDLPASSHGKTAAQEHWIMMQQMTPTRLFFEKLSENEKKMIWFLVMTRFRFDMYLGYSSI